MDDGMAPKGEGDVVGELSGKYVIIAGNRPMMNALTSYFLEQQGGAETDVAPGLKEAEAMLGRAEYTCDVVVWDVNDLAVGEIELTLARQKITEKCRLALMGVPQDSAVERLGHKVGVKGYFYEGNALELFVKGLRHICQDGLWMSRAVMERILSGPHEDGEEDLEPAEALTERERQILLLLAQGARNAEIAETLFISPHTVKAHLYKCFKKIGVSNRTMAARWASENLDL